MLRFSSVTLRTKGWALIGVVMLSLTVCVGLSAYALSQLKSSIVSTVVETVPDMALRTETVAAIEHAHLEMMRLNALINTGLTGEALDRRLESTANAQAQLETLLNAHENGQRNPILDTIGEDLRLYLNEATGALDMLSIEPISGTIMANATDTVFRDLRVAAEEVSRAASEAYVIEADEKLNTSERLSTLVYIAATASAILCVAVVVSVVQSVTKPVQAMKQVMQELASGNLEVEISHADPRTEIGQMASALDVFQQNARESQRMRQAEEASRLEKQQAERDAAAAREEAATQQAERAEKERAEAEARAANAQKLQHALSRAVSAAQAGDFSRRIDDVFDDPALEDVRTNVNTLIAAVEATVSEASTALKSLSDRKLGTRMQGKFEGAFAALQTDMNTTAEEFEAAIVEIAARADDISSNSSELKDAAENLAQRTERTAASLEETSAAMQAANESVGSVTTAAESAQDLVASTLQQAKAGQETVSRAITAMDAISKYSNEMAKAVEIIEGISFQTNLLALNAGVEAARAGEAGRGFSVVASEVRSLAVNAAESSKVIAELISSSSKQVEDGVKLVAEAGSAIEEMSTSFNQAASHVEIVTNSAQDQSRTISEVNAAISEIDRMTQMNAAMFEETTAATKSLSDSAHELNRLSAMFETSATRDVPAPQIVGAGHTEKRSKSTTAIQLKAEAQVAAAPVATEDGWEDF